MKVEEEIEKTILERDEDMEVEAAITEGERECVDSVNGTSGIAGVSI